LPDRDFVIILYLGLMIVRPHSLLFAAFVALCLAGCHKSRPAESATAKANAATISVPREEKSNATPVPVGVPSVVQTAATAGPAATPSATEPGEPFADWLKDLRQAAARKSATSAPAPSPIEPGVPFEVWISELVQMSRAKAAASPAPSPVALPSPAPAVSAAPSIEHVAAAEPEPPTVDNGEAARRAAADAATRRQLEILGRVYGGGPGFTGVGAGDGYTGAGAGDGYTGAGAGDGYTGAEIGRAHV
jgi:hypothetical protein